MSKYFRILGLLPLIGIFLATGCASKKQLQNQVNMLSNQVVALTDEVTNLSDNQQALERVVRTTESRQAQIEENVRSRPSTASRSTATKSRKSSGRASAEGGIYRTPSGFELPVRQIQQALLNAGYYSGNVDGVVGKMTEESITRFQNDNGLEADGICGRNTWAKLKQFA